jgi:hypothetical protein
MIITTLIHHRPVRTSVAFAMATSVLIGASACGTERATDRAPGSPKQGSAPSAQSALPPDAAECLQNQAKVPGASLRCWELTQPDGDREPSLLAPTGRPVPLPGSTG